MDGLDAKPFVDSFAELSAQFCAHCDNGQFGQASFLIPVLKGYLDALERVINANARTTELINVPEEASVSETFSIPQMSMSEVINAIDLLAPFNQAMSDDDDIPEFPRH